MGKVVRIIAGIGLAIVGAVTGNFQLVFAGVALIGGALLGPKAPKRAAAAAQLQLGEQPRQAVLGRAAVAGTLVDAFNYGGKYLSDWEVLVIALADHRCDALEGFFVDDTYVAFTGDGMVAGFNSQLQVFFRSGTWDQTVPSILTTNGPGWTANDRGRGVCYVVVAYKADASDAKNPVYPSGRPRFRWVLRGLRCYQARKDSTVGGSGAHRRDNPATWEWTENLIDIRYNWVRGIYAGDRVNEPGMLLVGRGLSAIEAPPANVFARANLCDELVGGQRRYRIGGVVASTEAFIEVESDFAAACAGVISQPEGSVEIDPGQAKAPVAHFTDADLLVGSTTRWSDFLGQQDEGWVNTVAARFVDPGQRWAVRGAPVRRDLADVIADGGPREAQPQLDMVTNAPQAQRIAEIIRRLGRLWGRGQVTLPPRFAFIEEGDWVTWQSNRYFKGATFTFRVEAWGSNEAWHHQLTLRQISASVFSDTAPLDDGVIASNQPAPPVVAAPAEGAWNAAAVLLGSGSVRIPTLRIGGATDDPAAQFVVFDYVQQAAAPGVSTIWTFASSSRPDVTLFDIPVPEGGTFWVGVSYVVDGIQGERRVLGPISTAGLAFADGSPVAPVAPANANRVPFSRFEGGQGWFNVGDAFSAVTSAPDGGRVAIQADPVFTVANQDSFLASGQFPVTASERLSVSSLIETFPNSGPAPSFWQIYVQFFNAAGAVIDAQTIASGAGAVSFAEPRLSNFVTAPAAARSMQMGLQVRSAGAGTGRMVIADPMVASAAAGQTVHPPYVPGPNANDGATVGAPAGTLVAGVESSALVGQAAQASSDALAAGAAAFAANLAIANITADNILSRDEKPEIRKQRDAIIAEYPVIRARAISFGVSVSGYDADYTALIAYLGGLDLGGATDTAITRATFNTFFTDYYAERQTVLDLIAAATSNALITVDANGNIVGIGAGAGTAVANTNVALSGTLAARPAAGAFTGQLYRTTDTLEIYRWNGTGWEIASDVTATAQREIVPQFPVIIINQGEPGNVGNRLVLHTARRGAATLSGGTFSRPAQNLGAGSASVNASTGTMTLSNVGQSGSFTIRYTHTDGIQTDLVVPVTFVPSTPIGTASDGPVGLSNTSSATFVPVTFRDLTVTLPAGVTSVTVSAVAVDLQVEAASPIGTFDVEFRVMRESSPGTWTAVGGVESSAGFSPTAFVAGVDEEFNEFFGSEPGAITISRTATGLSAGSTQKFRIEARRASGPTKDIFISGTASAST